MKFYWRNLKKFFTLFLYICEFKVENERNNYLEKTTRFSSNSQKLPKIFNQSNEFENCLDEIRQTFGGLHLF